MFKLTLLVFAAVLIASATAKPQVLVDYGYYAPTTYYAAAPLTYSYPYAYTYSYPYYYK